MRALVEASRDLLRKIWVEADGGLERQTPIWVTREGEEVPLALMPLSHLNNLWYWLHGRGQTTIFSSAKYRQKWSEELVKEYAYRGLVIPSLEQLEQ